MCLVLLGQGGILRPEAHLWLVSIVRDEPFAEPYSSMCLKVFNAMKHHLKWLSTGEIWAHDAMEITGDFKEQKVGPSVKSLLSFHILTPSWLQPKRRLFR